jgi:LmbE family N-acetylglucosaminyl deacetylase
MKDIILENKKILIVAPHPDDEIIGCFGVINKYAAQCDILLLTDGCKGHTKWSLDRTKRIRMSEFENVMKFLGVSNYKCLGITDRTLKNYIDCYCKLNLREYDVVFVPNKNEKHPDHSAAFYQLLLDKTLKRYKFEIFQYEVWSPLADPTHMLDISDVYDKKVKALHQYESQISELDYIGAIKGLNLYRGIMNHLKYAECFKKLY